MVSSVGPLTLEDNEVYCVRDLGVAEGEGDEEAGKQDPVLDMADSSPDSGAQPALLLCLLSSSAREQRCVLVRTHLGLGLSDSLFFPSLSLSLQDEREYPIVPAWQKKEREKKEAASQVFPVDKGTRRLSL